MRIIAAPDSTVNRHDRALWLTPPFDITLWIIIVPACRIYIVPAHNRLLTVAAENRLFSVPAEVRSLTVAAHNRTHTVPTHNRSYEVTCG